MFRYISMCAILIMTSSLGCERPLRMQGSAKDIQIESCDDKVELSVDKKIKLHVGQLANDDYKKSQSAVTSLLDIADESKPVRAKVLCKLIVRFNSFRRGRRHILPEERRELDAHLDLFLKLDAVEALDVMVKYIDSDQLFVRRYTLIEKAVVQFGENAIRSLEKGLTSNRDHMFKCRCALTLSGLKFKRRKADGINRTIEVLEKAKENEEAKPVVGCIEDAIRTLGQRKLETVQNSVSVKNMSSQI